MGLEVSADLVAIADGKIYLRGKELWHKTEVQQQNYNQLDQGLVLGIACQESEQEPGDKALLRRKSLPQGILSGQSAAIQFAKCIRLL
ncbi:MAG: hypothetical protein FJZ89_13020 [Chloroflexi bacterium]|nr:hypothetical protein [Chloroflexota bacterium]